MKKLKENIVRNKILLSLKQPTNFSELKKEIGVLSYGTLTYHLKILLEKGLIKKNKDKKRQGQPTIYFLSNFKNPPENQEDFLKKWEEDELQRKIKILNLLKEKPRKDSFFNNSSDELIADTILNCFDEGLTEMTHSINKEGEQFLEEHQNKT